MRNITVADVNSKVLELAKESPDAKYQPNRGGISYDDFKAVYSYVWGEAGPGTGCIFGQALQALGVSKQELLDFENNRFEVSIETLARHLGIPAHQCWADVQGAQDCGETWYEATRFLRDPERHPSCVSEEENDDEEAGAELITV